MRRLALLSLLLLSCSAPAVPPPPEAPPADPLTPPATDAAAPKGESRYADLDRATFNRMATRLNLPLYWIRDADGDGAADPDEIAGLLFYPTVETWVDKGKPTPAFDAAYGRMVELSKRAAPSGADGKRLALVEAELDAASSVLVRTDMRAANDVDKRFVAKMLDAARRVDALYAVQTGASLVEGKVAADPQSRSLFRRNWGIRCLTPKLEKEPGCTAAPGVDRQPVTAYPLAMQSDDAFCKKLEAEPNSKELLTPFSVVRESGGKLGAVKYTEAYADLVKPVAAELRAAAKVLEADAGEGPMRAYLDAAARGFETNDWNAADETWSKMNARNSKWYLRVGPDEVYWEPCSQKAGFHVSFARINKESLALQDQLAPHQQLMEDELAKLIGPPYKARKVTFHLPDFIDIVANAGDSRDPIGATIGQSLPNWGPVANEGRGRTVAVTNLYTDPDSMAVRRAKAASILVPETMAKLGDEPGPGLFGTVLHEATHNLGPSHEYKYQGKKDDQAFGGDLASMLEELKAQSGAYYYLYLLKDKGVIDDAKVEKTIVDNVVWGINHVSRGMYTARGQRKAYGQLAAVQIGFFMEEGALVWDPAAQAANGTDAGAFRIDFAKMRAASIKLMQVVGRIKAKNDKSGALALADKHVEKGSKVPHRLITERMLRFPQPTFVYSVEM